MTVKFIEATDDIKDILDKLIEAIEGGEADKDPNESFRLKLGRLVADNLETEDPRDIVKELQVLGAMVLNTQCVPAPGIDPRKAYRKLAGLAYDCALEVKSRTDARKG